MNTLRARLPCNQFQAIAAATLLAITHVDLRECPRCFVNQPKFLGRIFSFQQRSSSTPKSLINPRVSNLESKFPKTFLSYLPGTFHLLHKKETAATVVRVNVVSQFRSRHTQRKFLGRIFSFQGCPLSASVFESARTFHRLPSSSSIVRVPPSAGIRRTFPLLLLRSSSHGAWRFARSPCAGPSARPVVLALTRRSQVVWWRRLPFDNVAYFGCLSGFGKKYFFAGFGAWIGVEKTPYSSAGEALR